MGKFDDYVDRKTEAKENKRYYANKICAVPMCNNAGTSKNNITGEGQWYCRYRVSDPNCTAPKIETDNSHDNMLKQHFISLGIKQEGGKWKDSCMRYLKTVRPIGEI